MSYGKILSHAKDLDKVIQQLTTERLLTQDQNAANESVVEVTHEALIREWGLLRTWINENRDFMRWLEGLRTRIGGALLSGVDLAAAQKYLDSHAGQLNPEELGYIRRSMRATKHSQWLKRSAVVMGWQWWLIRQRKKRLDKHKLRNRVGSRS